MRSAVVLRCRAWLAHPAAYPTAVAAFGVLLLSGAKRFSLWQQITDLWGASPWEAFVHLHAHAPRLFLMQPVLWLAKHGVDQDLAFSLMCWLCLAVAGLLLARVAAQATGQPAVGFRAPAFLALAAASLPMYGRVVPAFLGVAILLAVAREARLALAARIGAAAFAVLLGSVSSGTFAVVAALAVALALLAAGPRPAWQRLGLGGAGLLLGGLTAAYALKALNALRSGAGDPWLLLTQGWGKVLIDIRDRGGDVAALLLLAGGLAWAVWWCWQAAGGAALTRGERAAVVIPCVVGLTGYNSFALVVPVVILAVLLAQARPDSRA